MWRRISPWLSTLTLPSPLRRERGSKGLGELFHTRYECPSGNACSTPAGSSCFGRAFTPGSALLHPRLRSFDPYGTESKGRVGLKFVGQAHGRAPASQSPNFAKVSDVVSFFA